MLRTAFALLCWIAAWSAEPVAADQSEIRRVPVHRIDLARIASSAPALEVRMASSAELERLGITFPELTTGLLMSQLIPAAGGAAAVPLLHVYAVWALVTLPAMHMYEERRQRIVERAMAREAFLSALHRALERRLSRLGLRTEGADGAPRLSLTVLGYGINRKPGAMENACVFVDASIKVEHRGKVLYEDLIYMEPFMRSADAPPPACHELAALTRGDGALLKAVVAETAEIIAAIVVHRLEDG